MRDTRIDLLRALGLAMIILAHVGPPATILQLRNFDVPLMVLISGMSFALAYKQERYIDYLWKRIKRLVFPVWIFLTIYFSVVAAFHLTLVDLSLRNVLRSYLFIDGIGYVWIIKVFLLVALVSPFIYHFHKNIRNDSAYFAAIILAFSAYEIFRIITQDFFSTGYGQTIAQVSHYIIPYSLIFAIGLRMPLMKITEVGYCMLVACGFFLTLAVFFWWQEGDFVPTQAHKYPPDFYYFSYAIAISSAAWILSGRVDQLLNKLPALKQTILFIAQNSIWVYLWHIPFIKLINASFPVKYFAVFALATGITFVQVWFVKHILIKKITHPPVQLNLKMILTG